MLLLVPYLVLGIVLFISSGILLATVVLNKRLREKYNVFSVKFGVDVLTAICLIVVGCLDRKREGQCDAALVISTSIPLVQSLLLVSEVADWWLAAFSPVYFHNSSILCRFLPFFIGVVFCSIIMVALVIIDLTTVDVSCVTSPSLTSIVSAYDISLALITLCLGALTILLLNHLRSSFFRPVLFHFVATLLLQEVPLLILIGFKYGGHSGVIFAADMVNFLVAAHALAHTAFFIYGHEDYRVRASSAPSFCFQQGVLSMLKIRKGTQ